MPSTLPELIARRFIQRRDVKAVQFSNGAYSPDRDLRNPDEHGFGFKKKHLLAHLDGSATYGHYLIDAEDKARVFVLDVDLHKTGSYPVLPDLGDMPKGIADDPARAEEWHIENTTIVSREEDEDGPGPRDWWADRKNAAARAWYKSQMKQIGCNLAGIVTKEMGLPCAVAYSGNKGIHVYGFLGTDSGGVPAEECREAGLYALDFSDQWELFRGKNFFRHRNQDPVMGYPSFTIEIYPKQSSLEGKDLGNLVRLPLGRNLKKPKDPTFFLNLNGRMSDFTPHPDPIQLLESGDPFQ